jgi:hypothetical protein
MRFQAVGRNPKGKPYNIEIRGAKPFSESGVVQCKK